MLTVRSQKADYYHPGGDSWETTPQISFSLATRGRTRDRMTICARVTRADECRRARVIFSSRSPWLPVCLGCFGGCWCEAVTKRRGCPLVWQRASCCSLLCRLEK